MKRQKCVAIIIADARGDGFYEPKCMTPFGGKYRLIDFALSCCVSAGITDVGIIADRPFDAVSEYIGNGRSWDLDRIDGGVRFLTSDSDAVNGFLNDDAQNVLVLRGDFIYRLDVAKMLDVHKNSHADCTIADVKADPRLITQNELVVSADRTDEILGIGAYIFTAEALKAEIDFAITDTASIISDMLDNGMTAVKFDECEYFSDVCDISAYVRANLDLLGSTLDVRDGTALYTRERRGEALTPCYIDGEVENSLICEGCEVYGSVINSVVGKGVTIAMGAVVKNSIVMSGTIIGENSLIDHAVICEDVTIGDGAAVGEGSADSEIAIIAKGVEIEGGERLVAGSIITD